MCGWEIHRRGVHRSGIQLPSPAYNPVYNHNHFPIAANRTRHRLPRRAPLIFRHLVAIGRVRAQTCQRRLHARPTRFLRARWTLGPLACLEERSRLRSLLPSLFRLRWTRACWIWRRLAWTAGWRTLPRRRRNRSGQARRRAQGFWISRPLAWRRCPRRRSLRQLLPPRLQGQKSRSCPVSGPWAAPVACRQRQARSWTRNPC